MGRSSGAPCSGSRGCGSPNPSAEQVDSLRRILHPSPCVVLDRPASLEVDPWGPVDPAVLALMRRVKEHFDPAGICSPGVFAGGL